MTDELISKEKHEMYAEMAASLKKYHEQTEAFWHAHKFRLYAIEKKYGLRAE